ncbi:hypothetical protein HPT27_08095 [Permianibacter sp. IMCC34836]|uniref:hypothetical protein n=1 Tax=Permianibacter fluminis TaxID=2738515 RepID=UPI001557AFC4|nr:hypothetical protein [Permianibacter fluminis]NQD36983.1 hypothetical protein [Permianibacter fluminis]
MTVPTDHYRRKNEAERKAAMQATVEARKRDWKEAGLLDDIARNRVVEHDQTLWKGQPWWVERIWVRWLANGLCVLTVAGIARAAMTGAAFDLAFWIPFALFAFQLRWHIARHGG